MRQPVPYLRRALSSGPSDRPLAVIFRDARSVPGTFHGIGGSLDRVLDIGHAPPIDVHQRRREIAYDLAYVALKDTQQDDEWAAAFVWKTDFDLLHVRSDDESAEWARSYGAWCVTRGPPPLARGDCLQPGRRTRWTRDITLGAAGLRERLGRHAAEVPGVRPAAEKSSGTAEAIELDQRAVARCGVDREAGETSAPNIECRLARRSNRVFRRGNRMMKGPVVWRNSQRGAQSACNLPYVAEAGGGEPE